MNLVHVTTTTTTSTTSSTAVRTRASTTGSGFRTVLLMVKDEPNQLSHTAKSETHFLQTVLCVNVSELE